MIRALAVIALTAWAVWVWRTYRQLICRDEHGQRQYRERDW